MSVLDLLNSLLSIHMQNVVTCLLLGTLLIKSGKLGLHNLFIVCMCSYVSYVT